MGEARAAIRFLERLTIPKDRRRAGGSNWRLPEELHRWRVLGRGSDLGLSIARGGGKSASRPIHAIKHVKHGRDRGALALFI